MVKNLDYAQNDRPRINDLKRPISTAMVSWALGFLQKLTVAKVSQFTQSCL